ncbi:MAG: PIN domain-containing protein [Chloroflexota bacterium]
MTTRRAVLDADIIFSRVLHELIGRLAVGPRLFDLVWSDALLDEAKSSLVRQKGLSDEAAETWVGHMRREFPGGRVDPVEVPDGLDPASLTRDPGDAHVCALAIAGGVDLLFTFDRGYLKEPLRDHGIEVPDLDAFLVDQCKEQPEVFARIVERQADVWDGGHPVAALLAAFSRAGVPRLAEALAPLVES